MIRIKFDSEKLEEISARAKEEDRTVLGIIYSEYIGVHFPLVKTLNPKNIYCTAKFISTILELDRKLMGDEANGIYLQYAPSIFNFKTFTIDPNEMIAVAWQNNKSKVL